MELVAQRRAHDVDGISVADLLVLTCQRCERVVAVPQQSVGRIFAAQFAQNAVETLEVRVQPELIDVALGVHVALGIEPRGDLFSLPLQLGLRAALTRETPLRVTFNSVASERARPRLSGDALKRIQGLRRTWGMRKDADVVRSLVVLAWSAVQRISL